MNLFDLYQDTLSPVYNIMPVFTKRDGIFTPAERILLTLKQRGLDQQANKKDPASGSSIVQVNIYGKRSIDYYRSLLSAFHSHGYTLELKTMIFEEMTENKAPIMTPADLLASIGDNIQEDILLIDRKDFPVQSEPSYSLVGSATDVFIHPSVSLSKMVEIDATGGPVFIGPDVNISAFSVIKGPVAIHAKSQLDNVQLSNSIVGNTCRLGGEISDSIIGNFSNKHHEGFLGHSIVGDWVNLGALTTTSDLKNNYGEIRLHYKGRVFDTDIIKFGSIIGDFVKTGIGTMLNTGTVIDTGGLLFEGRPLLKYYPPFFWGGSEPSKYKLKRFIEDATRIMARRDVKPTELIKNTLTRIHEQS